MILTFDIETIPDLEAGRNLYDLGNLDDQSVAKAMLASRRLRVPGADYLPLHHLRIIAISVALRGQGSKFTVWSLGNANTGEKEMVSKFFDLIEEHNPTLVSWNGNGFDLPVIQYRALLHSIPSRIYWDTGQFEREAKFSNYLSRYHDKHVDVMDLLSRYQVRATAALHEIAVLLGLPGKLGLDNTRILDAFLAGENESIRNYCDIDVLNTYLVFLRLKYIRGGYTSDQYKAELEIVRNWLIGRVESESHSNPQFEEFLKLWAVDNQLS